MDEHLHRIFHLRINQGPSGEGLVRAQCPVVDGYTPYRISGFSTCQHWDVGSEIGDAFSIHITHP